MWSAGRSGIVVVDLNHRPRIPMTTNVRTMRWALLLALLLAVAVPAGASAATVVRQGDGTLVYTAAGSVKNHVGVQVADDDSTITFYTNSGDPMNAPAGCTPSDLYGGDVVTCTMPTAVRVELGAGDDDAYASDGIPVPVTINGGPGADWLTAACAPATGPITSMAAPGTTASTAASATTC
jgi:hypothetical protein